LLLMICPFQTNKVFVLSQTEETLANNFKEAKAFQQKVEKEIIENDVLLG